jgi:predicted lipoprotein with Yx(FWY)xxD motif
MQSTSTRSPRSAPWLKVAIAAAAMAFVAVGCGSSSKSTSAGGSSGTTGTTASQSETTTQAADVMVAKSSLGDILVDSKGMTIYLFTDDKSTTSACTGGCLTAWPPVTSTSTAPTAGPGVTAKVTTAKQTDGSEQLVVNGHLVYTFAKDAKPGDTTGQGVGNVWYVLTPAGDAITTAAPTTSG